MPAMTRSPAREAFPGDMNLHAIGPPQGFWGLLTDTEQAVLSALGRMSVFPPGATMCVEGEPATHVFVLIAGWVKILSVTSEGHELVLALRGHGDIVGELAGEATGYRTATVQAIDTVRSLIVGHDRFSSFLDSHPGASHAYRRVVTQRWRDAAAMLRRRSVTSGAQRLAVLLLDLAGQHGTGSGGEIYLAMPLSQEELASLAGASRATVTRALSNWRQRGFIRTGQRRITIIDLPALRQIASD
ncbi:MAG TPA: Crp/Fnr family transcriptional regulator [Streptosporangiaceae bacterium]|nr:Crp/Fnr family transcriptional regulator [Streptosporangiaceae bacterium]